MIVSEYERAFNAPDVTTERMKAAINRWFSLYYDWEECCESSTSPRIPYVIVDDLTRAVFGEYEYLADGEAMADTYERLDRIRLRAFRAALIGGEAFLKPVPVDGGFDFSLIKRNAYIVFGRDPMGRITGIGTSERTAQDKYFYTLLERRTLKGGGLEIENTLYRSATQTSIGQRVALTELEQYAMLKPLVTLPVNSLGLIHVKTPGDNCVDESHDGVSIYAPAIKAIDKVCRHERRTDDEYELTEPRLIASMDLYRKDERGRVKGVPRYIEAIDDAPEDVGITVYNPTPHQAELEAREDQLLRQIENIIGLRRGAISHVDSEDKTATEVLTSSGRYASTIMALQGMWGRTMDEAREVLTDLGKIYGFGPAPEVSINWGNGVLYDEEQEYQRIRDAVAMGNLRPEYIPAWLFGEKLDAPEDYKRVAEKYLPEMTALEAQRTVFG